MKKNHPNTELRSNKKWLILRTVFVLSVALITLFVWRLYPKKPAPPSNRLTIKQTAELVKLKNLAISHLENERFSQADALLTELVQKLPGEAFGPRNLTISRILNFQSEQRDAEKIRFALKMVAKNENDSAVTAWLTAQAELRAQEKATDPAMGEQKLLSAISSLEQAIQRDPKNIIYQYALFDAGRYSDDAKIKSAAEQALRIAYQLQRDNLFLTTDWLTLQAENKDPKIIDTLDRFRKTTLPFRESIKRRTGVDLDDFIQQAITAAKGKQWPTALGCVRRIAVVVRPEDQTQSDRRLLIPHLLEFALFDFSKSFYQREESVTEPAKPGIAVKLLPWKLDGDLAQMHDVVDCKLVDFDLDAKLDFVVLREGVIQVYSRTEKTKHWKLIAKAPAPAGSLGFLLADLDRDISTKETKAKVPKKQPSDACFVADIDLVVYGAAGIVVLKNDRDLPTGKRTLRQIEQLPELKQVRDVLTAVTVDFDHDGDLDFAVSSKQGVSLWTNRGDMTFGETSKWSSLPPKDIQFTTMIAVDWDRDADLDILLHSNSQVIGYLENMRHGQLSWRSFSERFADIASATSCLVAELDGNASWDIVGVGKHGMYSVQTENPRSGTVQFLTSYAHSKTPGEKLINWDYDNDGQQDVLAWNSHGSSAIYRGGGQGRFQEIRDLVKHLPQNIQACDIGDLDNDGDLDLFVVSAGKIVLLKNDGGNQNHWLDVHVLGVETTKSGRVNHYGLGSLLEVKSGRSYQAGVVQRPISHFGLGEKDQADAVRVLWTNGVPQAVLQPQADQTICEKMTLKGSCPYLYTWNGKQFEFYTDLLWAAPLGLQFSEGVLAPARPWEYLKIDGEQLQQRDEGYQVRVTEELWEAAYFDKIQLIAVDHPADVEIFSNEKVGPASLAKYKIHTVKKKRPLAAARDQQGRDVLPKIAHRDSVFLKPFDRRLRQGLTEEHYFELDLGKLDHPEKITLFLTGWIYPSDTSLNIALSQNPQLHGPKPPSISVPDAQGRWREVKSFMGFPGGKTKTIAIDLSDLFLTDDYRLRITTSSEIYWDEVFFTVDEPASPLKVQPLTLQSAELHYRGFSRPLPKRPHAPEIYDYQQVSPAAKWPPMSGRFTRYGDVKALLTTIDDRLLVIGPGDEVKLSFALPIHEPPPGWKRDFLLYNVGWDKDADLNTVYGQTVEPLPFFKMQSYPFGIDETPPNSPSYRNYLRRYQTREQTPSRFWKQLK